MTDGSTTSGDTDRPPSEEFESGDGSHHPGPPRFVTVDDGFVNPNRREPMN